MSLVIDAVSRRWLIRQAGLMALLAGVLLLVFESFPLDLWLERFFFDATLNGFPMQHHWLFSDVMHSGFKAAAYALGFFSIAFCVYVWHTGATRLSRRQALLAGMGVILIPLLTAGLKYLTNRHCPWDIVNFGGYAPYVSLFGAISHDMTRGVCFPAGHASAGFVWVIWGLALRSAYPALAHKALIFGLAAGAVMGLGRMAQGAHFLSHVLWSAWFAWSLGLVMAAALQVQLVPARASAETLKSGLQPTPPRH